MFKYLINNEYFFLKVHLEYIYTKIVCCFWEIQI